MKEIIEIEYDGHSQEFEIFYETENEQEFKDYIKEFKEHFLEKQKNIMIGFEQNDIEDFYQIKDKYGNWGDCYFHGDKNCGCGEYEILEEAKFKGLEVRLVPQKYVKKIIKPKEWYSLTYKLIKSEDYGNHVSG